MNTYYFSSLQWKLEIITSVIAKQEYIYSPKVSILGLVCRWYEALAHIIPEISFMAYNDFQM
jgi:hypothetical protein